MRHGKDGMRCRYCAREGEEEQEMKELMEFQQDDGEKTVELPIAITPPDIIAIRDYMLDER